MFAENEIKSEYVFLPCADDLFCGLTPDAISALDKIKRTERLRKGVCLFARGEPPRVIYRLREGNAILLLNDESNNKRIARLIEPDEIFGLTEAFAELPYATGAETITPCLCEFFEREAFVRFLIGEPEFCFRLARLLAFNLQKTYRLFSLINLMVL